MVSDLGEMSDAAARVKPTLRLTVLVIATAALVMGPMEMSEWLDGRGHRAFAEKRYADAVDLYARALWWSWYGCHPDLYCELGDAHDMSGSLDAALADYDEAIRRSPKTSRYRFERAIALARAGRHAEALTGYDSAVALTDRRPLYYLRRAVSLCELKLWARAGADLDAYERLATPSDAGVLCQARAVLSSVKATAAGGTPPSISPKPALTSLPHLAFETRARVLEGLGDTAGAGDAWCEAVWTDPTCAEARRGLAASPLARTRALPAAWAP